MTLQIAITDFVHTPQFGVCFGATTYLPIIKAEITGENSPSIFSDKHGEASKQCARYETLAVKIKELVETFYRDETTNLRNAVVEIID